MTTIIIHPWQIIIESTLFCRAKEEVDQLNDLVALLVVLGEGEEGEGEEGEEEDDPRLQALRSEKALQANKQVCANRIHS